MPTRRAYAGCVEAWARGVLNAAASPPVAKSEQPAILGGPYTPAHTAPRRVGYLVTGVMIALLGTFGNGLVSTNLAAVAGEYGIDSADSNWLTIAYTGMSAGAALFVIKGRQQFGIDRIVKILLLFYASTAIIELLIPSFATAILARAANGLVTSTGVTIAIYYILEALPVARRPVAVIIVLGAVQISAPLARLVPVEMLTQDANHGQRLLDLAIPLIELALIFAWPLPPTPTARVFEKLDLLTIALLLPALLLIIAVLGAGRAHWWLDTPWLGWLLAFAVPFVSLGLLLEMGRTSPALRIGWMTSGHMLRFAAIAFLERIAVSEQNIGAIGLLSAGGLNNDQLHGFFAIIALAMLAGIAAAVLTMSEKAIPFQVSAALLMIGAASWFDSFSSELTGLPQLVFTQAVIGFATTLFVGPALLWGVLQVMKSGPRNLLSLVMIFTFTQNVGSLTGSALLSSYQYARGQEHGRVIEDDLTAARPQVQEALIGGTLAASAVTPDRATASAISSSALAGAMQRQASVLGFLDVFRLVTVVSLAGVLIVAVFTTRSKLGQRKEGRGK